MFSLRSKARKDALEKILCCIEGKKGYCHRQVPLQVRPEELLRTQNKKIFPSFSPSLSQLLISISTSFLFYCKQRRYKNVSLCFARSSETCLLIQLYCEGTGIHRVKDKGKLRDKKHDCRSAQVKYGGRSPKFIWAPCHVMCTAVLIG